ncbi:winged helix-turn-helix domain-containing protein [Streptomyces sp. RerS4]|uniref:winged helix-turn-helix domain-containing protein n=1 Tax=Streptomyces sp. RerS4 TaxID=2942449 RepID=UPI00201C61FB|nr:winged helix-turn-helix domain-containing protein [Streptomyces sp. RerS4]UQW99265.1 winged helix-turn-helix domain-containing protein [Streptomyces sp. RerS4]
MGRITRGEGDVVLRVHFTVEDLAQVQVTVLGPLAETQLSLQTVQRRDRAALFGGWRARTGPQIGADGRETARFLSSSAGGLVDLFTLVGAVGCMDEGIERLISASDRRLHAEFSVLPRASTRRAPWLAEAMDGDPRTVRRMAVALQGWNRVAVDPYWGRIDQHLVGEVARRGRLMVQGGAGALLDSLRPMAVWQPPVLEIPGYRPLIHPEADFHLGGRPFILAPSVFCGPVPQLFASPQAETVVMVYPALNNPVHAAALWASPTDMRQVDAPVPPTLSALLGRTRAIVLCVIADHPACTTTQLAQLAGISPASASEHATTLRSAGLTTLTRQRKVALHTLTHLGLTLLNTNGSVPAGS